MIFLLIIIPIKLFKIIFSYIEILLSFKFPLLYNKIRLFSSLFPLPTTTPTGNNLNIKIIMSNLIRLRIPILLFLLIRRLLAWHSQRFSSHLFRLSFQLRPISQFVSRQMTNTHVMRSGFLWLNELERRRQPPQSERWEEDRHGRNLEERRTRRGPEELLKCDSSSSPRNWNQQPEWESTRSSFTPSTEGRMVILLATLLSRQEDTIVVICII